LTEWYITHMSNEHNNSRNAQTQGSNTMTNATTIQLTQRTDNSNHLSTNLECAKKMLIEAVKNQTDAECLHDLKSCIAVASLNTYIRCLEIELGVDESDMTPLIPSLAVVKLTCQELNHPCLLKELANRNA